MNYKAYMWYYTIIACVAVFVGYLFLLSASSGAQTISEHDYAKPWCKERKGILEYELPDKTRIDCLTETHAVEVERAHRWAESIGQALHYARMSETKAGIALIIEHADECRHLDKIQNIIRTQCIEIDIWTIGGSCGAESTKQRDTQ